MSRSLRSSIGYGRLCCAASRLWRWCLPRAPGGQRKPVVVLVEKFQRDLVALGTFETFTLACGIAGLCGTTDSASQIWVHAKLMVNVDGRMGYRWLVQPASPFALRQ